MTWLQAKKKTGKKMSRKWNRPAVIAAAAIMAVSISACTNPDFAPNDGSELTASSRTESKAQHTDSNAPTASPAKINPLEDDFKDASSGTSSGDESVPSADENTGITNSDVRMRSNPGGSNVGTVPNNTQVTIIGKSGNWYQVRYNGKEGYIYGQYLTLSDGSNGLESGDEDDG